MTRRLLLLLLALLAGVAGAVPAAASAVSIGIADQKPDMFSDARFVSNHIRYARRSIPWDVLSHRGQRAQLDAWMFGARVRGVQPLLSFSHAVSTRTKVRRKLPTPSRLLAEFRKLRKRYPWAKDYATWNEANHCGEPTCHRPKLVASYWRKLRKACRSCHVLAAEILDEPNMTRWIRDFRRAAKSEPRYWGLHNYLDANYMRTSGTRTMLRSVKGLIWVTETGGIVKRHNHSKIRFKESAKHAAAATRYLFRKVLPLSGRLQRVYVYQWNIGRGFNTWDSALIGPSGRTRPAYGVVRTELRRLAAAKRARAKRKAKAQAPSQ